jgi:hypothetical protein
LNYRSKNRENWSNSSRLLKLLSSRPDRKQKQKLRQSDSRRKLKRRYDNNRN